MTDRPLYHFTPPQNFMNDPNGLVFFDGEYHLFYQHNPFGDVWGHMSWGHAVSRDLIHWEHLPVALHEENDIMIFSGSAVVDWNNTSGFGTPENPPLVAIYTGHSETEQNQNIAYSTDRGRTWNKYEGNPVIAIGMRDFRDPKVFWHEPTQRWIMVTVLSDQHKVRFDSSTDLKLWNHLSDFGPAGAMDGQWECPDLFALPVEGEPGRTKWVLKVDVLRGTGAQYFTGVFDGTHFSNDSLADEIKRVDFGEDFYAAQSWSDEPHGRRIWIGWMNNWHYANDIPTSPWRGLFSIPRRLSLQGFHEGLRLVQQPVEEVGQFTKSIYHAENLDIARVNEQLAALELDMSQEIRVQVTPDTVAAFGLKLRTGDGEETVIGYDVRSQELFVDRERAGDSSFSDQFAGVHRAPLAPQGGKISLHIFLDSCSIEVFADGGSTVISDLIFPRFRNMRVEFYADDGGARLDLLDICSLSHRS
jgi:fructan beta-fructosidase